MHPTFVLGSLLTFAAAFCGMEAVAYLAHRFLMHGPLWVLHRDHHQGSPRQLQRNDAFFVIFAAPAIACIALGVTGHPLALAVGVGIAAYGATYVLVHELLIHQRVRFLPRARGGYVQAVRRAHRMHHRHLEREHGEAFGMLWVPRRYRESQSAGFSGVPWWRISK